MKFEDLQKLMFDAMKAHESDRKEMISLLVAAVKKAAIDSGNRDDISEEMVNATILKELKSVKEQIDTCPESRQDLLEKYKANLKIVEEFAPKLLSGDEVESILKSKFSEVLATKNKGQIMKAVMSELKGKADGKVINEIVAKLTQ